MLFVVGVNAFAQQGWTPSLEIQRIDSLPNDGETYITLKNYTNSVCSNHRIMLKAYSDEKFNQLLSMVLGAFYANGKVSFYLGNDNDCDSYRVTLEK